MALLQFSESIILTNSKTTHRNALENQSALSVFGITVESLNQFGTKIQTAEALPNETAQRIELRGLTVDKDEAMDNCIDWGRNLRIRLQLAFGKNSPEAISFPSEQFRAARSSENIMMPVMEILITQAEKYQVELSAFGQTPEELAAGQICLDQLRSADAAQELQKDTKRSATQERYAIFSELYETTNKINRIGRAVFENDPIKYELFKSKWPKAKVEETTPGE